MLGDLDQIAEFGTVETIKEDIRQVVYTTNDRFMEAFSSIGRMTVSSSFPFVSSSDTFGDVRPYVWRVDDNLPDFKYVIAKKSLS